VSLLFQQLDPVPLTYSLYQVYTVKNIFGGISYRSKFLNVELGPWLPSYVEN
jgi:hypothetical protein